ATIMNPPPPMFPASGHVTAIASAVATAASTAFPPFFSVASPTSAAGGDTHTTTPPCEVTVCAFGWADVGAVVRKSSARRRTVRGIVGFGRCHSPGERFGIVVITLRRDDRRHWRIVAELRTSLLSGHHGGA